ncbi:MAG: hypothetical protein EBS05_20650 [Proteobacteria bacterium]|nr:hypothetical protein [Pseudomonadota bacterium]
MQHLLPVLFLATCLSTFAADKKAAAGMVERETEYYPITTLPTPPGVQFESGALMFLGPDKIVCATRIGDIWIGEGLQGAAPQPKWKLFASGLHEVLGLASRDGWIYATQRGEITRLKDTKGTGRADVVETVTDMWGINGDYHEYAFGSKFDRNGDIWVVLCLTGSFNSSNPYRGWCVRVSADGKVTPANAGIRSPGGIGFNALGEVFYTDNQGPWNGACKLHWLKPGAFMGHPGGIRWFDDPGTKDAIAKTGLKKPEEPKSGGRLYDEAKHIPELLPPSVYFPYPQMGQSASGIACDVSGGKFGPFKEQLFVGDQSHSTVMRVYLEKTPDGQNYQGACFPFKVGFGSGALGLEFSADPALYVFGTDRGWGARGGKPYALERLTWTGKTPFEIHEMHARTDGFELTFTEPVDAAAAGDAASYVMTDYIYIYQAAYGSPEVDKGTPKIVSAKVAPDGRSVRLKVEGLVEGHVHELHCAGVKSAKGLPLLHDAAYYTLNRIPRL